MTEREREGEKRRVELPALDEIDAELAEMALRKRWLLRVKRFIVKMGAGEKASDG